MPPSTLEKYFALPSEDPLQHAFSRRHVEPPGSEGEAIAASDYTQVWNAVQQAPRHGQAVMYLHVPFCANHCLFCGFYRYKWEEEHSSPYADALIRELEQEADSVSSRSAPINAVYFGGGTPTALAGADLARIIRRIRSLYPLAPDCEITVEGRIFHFDNDKVEACLDAGANRLSTGVQTFDTLTRRRQGRKATGEDAIRFFEGLTVKNRAAIVCDLILGLPYQTEKVWQDDLRIVEELALDGVDLYTLALFPGSPLSKAIQKGACEPAVDLGMKGLMYGSGLEYLNQQGWTQISSSHWARSTRERNLYNSLVKSGADCLAFGSGAGGNMSGYAYGINSDLNGYYSSIEEGEKPLSYLQRNGQLSGPINHLAAGIEGMRLDLARLEREHPKIAGFSSAIAPVLDNWRKCHLIEGFPVLRLTTAGRFWHQTLLSHLKSALRLYSTDLEQTH
ncbi:MAG: heme anaerobic degradation radical SAM methyltransferase ChuW/HutW [Pseudomonadota bacterium]